MDDGPVDDAPVDDAPAGRPSLTTVEPLQVNMTRVVLAGIVAWAVTLVVLLLARDELRRHGTSWWIWTCVVAIGLGGFGLAYVRRRER
ncbi:MAG: DUF2530 domain-containing protein [Actinomycetales bacterium]